MKPKKYRKKPIVIESSQWFTFGDHLKVTWRPSDNKDFNTCKECGCMMYVHGQIDTREGVHIVCPGDWIIKGVEGEFYPCKPEIFKKTYEEVRIK